MLDRVNRMETYYYQPLYCDGWTPVQAADEDDAVREALMEMYRQYPSDFCDEECPNLVIKNPQGDLFLYENTHMCYDPFFYSGEGIPYKIE